MSWRDELRTPRFRGITFNAVELGSESGRRIVADDTPESEDLSPTADLGPIRPSFRMRAFVVGDDYLDQRERLLAALNTQGPGELVLPWRGNLFVQTGKVSDTLDMDHGKCVIEFECVLHEGRARPFVEVVPATSAEDQAALASEEAQAHYTTALSAGEARVQDFDVFAVVPEVEQFVRIVGVEVEGGIDDVLDTIDDAQKLLAYIRSAAAAVWHSLGSSRDDALAEACTGVRQGIRIRCLVRVAEIAMEADYITANQAEEVMFDVAAEFGVWLAVLTDHDFYLAMLDLRTSMADVLSAAAERLPRERTINVPAPTPAIVIAFDTYGPKRLEAREAELIKLNGIGHPGFAHGDITVLSR